MRRKLICIGLDFNFDEALTGFHLNGLTDIVCFYFKLCETILQLKQRVCKILLFDFG